MNKMKLRAIRSVSGAETAGNNYDDIDRSVLYYSTDKIEHIIELDVKAVQTLHEALGAGNVQVKV